MKYETPADVLNEHSLAEWFKQRTKLTGAKLTGDFHPFDYVFARPGRPLYVEIKFRKTPHNQYPTYSIEHSKVHHAEVHDLAAIALVRWSDKIGMINLRLPYEVKSQTHRTRNITAMVAHYDLSDVVFLT